MSGLLQQPPERFFCFYTHSPYLFSTEQPKDPLTITPHFTKIYNPYNGPQGPVTSALISIPHSFSPLMVLTLAQHVPAFGFCILLLPCLEYFFPRCRSVPSSPSGLIKIYFPWPLYLKQQLLFWHIPSLLLFSAYFFLYRMQAPKGWWWWSLVP